MKVYDLIKKFSKEQIFDRLLEIHPWIFEEWEKEDEREAIKKGFFFAYDDLLKTSFIEDDFKYVVVVCKQISTIKGEDDDFEVSQFKVDMTKNSPYEFDGENCLDCRFDVVFSPWEEVLGRDICSRSLSLYGELDCACVIFHDLIRMGLSNEYRTNRIKEEFDTLREREKNFKEEECIPAEQFFDELRKEFFNETEEERIERHKREEIEREERRPYIEWAIGENQQELFRFKKFIAENY